MQPTSAPLLPNLGTVYIGRQRFVKVSEHAPHDPKKPWRVMLGLRKPKGRKLFIAFMDKENGQVTNPVPVPGYGMRYPEADTLANMAAMNK